MNKTVKSLKGKSIRSLRIPRQQFVHHGLICRQTIAIVGLTILGLMTQQAMGQQQGFDNPPTQVNGMQYSTRNNMLGPVKQYQRTPDLPPSRTIPVQVSDPQNENERFVHQRPNDAMPSDAGLQPMANDPLDERLASSSETASKDPLASFAGFEGTRPVLKVVGGLCVVIAIFFAFTLISKRNGGKVSGKIPDEILQILAQMPLDQKRQFQLVRFGSQILLLSVADKNVQTIGAISDPIEVEHVLSLIQKGRAAEAYGSFRRVTSQIRQQRRAQRMYPSQMHPESEISETPLRVGSNNVFEA